MSEYELAYLLSEFRSALGFHLSIFMTTVFAMLVAAHLAATQLSRVTSWLLVAIYTMFSLLQFVPILQSASDIMALSSIIRRFALDHPQSLLAITASTFPSSEGAGIALGGILLTILLATFTGSLCFYFSCRNRVPNFPGNQV